MLLIGVWIRNWCLYYKVPLFEKESLKPIIGELTQEFPEEINDRA